MGKTWVSTAITRTKPTPLPKEVTNDTMKYKMSHISLIITLIKRVEQLSRPELSARIHPTTWKRKNDRFDRA
jgi:hypothetical protein